MNWLSGIFRKKEIRQGAAAIAAVVLTYFLLPSSMPEAARRTACVFVFAALFWALEIIPLYATSLLVVLLQVFLLARPGGVLDMDSSGYAVFLVPFGSPVIMLFFGGFVLAAALQKYHIDKYLASAMLKGFGEKPYFIMLGFMVCTAVLSMWMSNTATTAMMMAMVMPLLMQFEEGDRFRTGLILSIPFAANIGGIGTPVGTPPNAIAIGILANEGIRVDFFSWMKMAVPLAVILIIAASFILYILYPPKIRNLRLQIEKKTRFDRKTVLTMMVAGVTIFLWLTSSFHKIPSSVIALLAAGLLAGMNLMTRDDFKRIDWDVLVLMWGGLALGEGMEISGLTKWIVAQPLFGHHGFVLVAVFCLLAVILSTFMSNTATANLLIPVVISIPGESHLMLAATVALSCSFAMALPVSTPPNAIAFATNMLKSRDMLKAGLIISVISVITVLFGFEFMLSKAFHLP